MADNTNTCPNQSAQFKARGYIIDEDSEFALQDMFAAMNAISYAYDLDRHAASSLDMTGDEVGSVLRSFARLGSALVADAPFANTAMARPRSKRKRV